MKRVIFLSFALVACGGPSSEPGSPWNPLRREVPEFAEGINAYKDSRWVDAEKKFDFANGQTPSSAGHFDLGSAQYRQKKLQEAGENFNRVLSSMNEEEKERAYFNLGNTEASGGNLEKAKDYYRRALELRPNDMDARYNLEWAQRMLEKPKDQNDKGKPDDQKKDDQKQEDKKNDDQQAENDKKDGDKQKEDANKKKDEEKKEGEEKKAENDKKDGEEKKAGAGQQEKPGEDKKEGAGEGKEEEKKGTEGKLAEGEPQPGGKEQKLDKQETAAILDSLLAGEKNLQMWKFQQNGKRPPPRSESAKPW